MTKFNTDLANERLQKLGDRNEWKFMSPWDYFYEGILYGMELAKEKEQENMEDTTSESSTSEGSALEGSTSQGSALEGTHYFYTTTVGHAVVGNYFPTKEEAEVGRAVNEEFLSLFKGLLNCEISEIIERQGKIEEAYSILPNGEKFTLSDVQKLFQA